MPRALTQFLPIQPNERGQFRYDPNALSHHCLRSSLHRLRRRHHARRARLRCRHRAHAGNRGGHSGRRCRLSRAPIHDDRRCRRRHLSHPRLSARVAAGHRLRHRRRAVGRRGLYRHERIGARQCAHGAGRDQEPRRRLEPRLPRRRHHRPARCRPRASRRFGLFPRPHLDARL